MNTVTGIWLIKSPVTAGAANAEIRMTGWYTPSLLNRESKVIEQRPRGKPLSGPGIGVLRMSALGLSARRERPA